MQKLNSIQEILKKITPTQADRAKITALVRELRQRVALACQEQGVKAVVRVEGSVAKDTWLREDPEIDGAALDQNFISITPVKCDMTDYHVLKDLRNWDLIDTIDK